MLYLMRKVGESIIVNNSIEVTVVEVKGHSVRLGFTFPPEATILRKEVHERAAAENRLALGSTEDASLLEHFDIQLGLKDE